MPDPYNHRGLVQDCETLLFIRDRLAAIPQLNWEVGPLKAWEGVTVSGSPPRVTALMLSDRLLTGAIPPEIANLTGLHELYLVSNFLNGNVPVELCSLQGLTVLNLSFNQLVGEMPPELCLAD